MRMNFKKDNKLVEMSFDNFTFEDTGKGWVEIDADNIRVLIDGEEKETYGENFAGHKYDAADVFTSIIEAYISCNDAVEYIEVPEEVKVAKVSFCDELLVGDRIVPKRIIHNRDILDLKAVSNGYSKTYKSKNPDCSEKYKGCAVYLNENGGSVLTDELGAIITDIEAFWMSGVLQINKEDNIVFGKEYLEKIAEYYEE